MPQDLAALRGLLLLISDPVLLLSENLELLEANPAAQQLLGQGPGQQAKVLHALQTSHGGRLGDWLRLASRAQLDGRRGPPAPGLKLANGQRASLSLVALEAQDDNPARWLLHARSDEKSRLKNSLVKPPVAAKATAAAVVAKPALPPPTTDAPAQTLMVTSNGADSGDQPAPSSAPLVAPLLAPPLAEQQAREQILREQAERTQPSWPAGWP